MPLEAFKKKLIASNLKAKDLTVIGYIGGTQQPQITTLAPAQPRGKQDAIAVHETTTIDGKELTVGLWYWPQDFTGGAVEDLIKLPGGVEAETKLIEHRNGSTLNLDGLNHYPDSTTIATANKFANADILHIVANPGETFTIDGLRYSNSGERPQPFMFVVTDSVAGTVRQYGNDATARGTSTPVATFRDANSYVFGEQNTPITIVDISPVDRALEAGDLIGISWANGQKELIPLINEISDGVFEFGRDSSPARFTAEIVNSALNLTTTTNSAGVTINETTLRLNSNFHLSETLVDSTGATAGDSVVFEDDGQGGLQLVPGSPTETAAESPHFTEVDSVDFLSMDNMPMTGSFVSDAIANGPFGLTVATGTYQIIGDFVKATFFNKAANVIVQGARWTIPMSATNINEWQPLSNDVITFDSVTQAKNAGNFNKWAIILIRGSGGVWQKISAGLGPFTNTVGADWARVDGGDGAIAVDPLDTTEGQAAIAELEVEPEPEPAPITELPTEPVEPLVSRPNSWDLANEHRWGMPVSFWTNEDYPDTTVAIQWLEEQVTETRNDQDVFELLLVSPLYVAVDSNDNEAWTCHVDGVDYNLTNDPTENGLQWGSTIPDDQNFLYAIRRNRAAVFGDLVEIWPPGYPTTEPAPITQQRPTRQPTLSTQVTPVDREVHFAWSTNGAVLFSTVISPDFSTEEAAPGNTEFKLTRTDSGVFWENHGTFNSSTEYHVIISRVEITDASGNVHTTDNDVSNGYALGGIRERDVTAPFDISQVALIRIWTDIGGEDPAYVFEPWPAWLLEEYSLLPPTLIPATAPNPEATVGDPNAWQVSHSDDGLTVYGAGPGDAAFELQWETIGFTFTSQGGAGSWTLTRFFEGGNEIHNHIPADSSRLSTTIADPAISVGFTYPGASEGWRFLNPNAGATTSPDWQREEHDRIGAEWTLTKNELSVYFLWLDEEHLILRIDGAGDWKIKTNGESPLDETFTVGTEPTYYSITDGTSFVELWEPAETGNAIASIREAYRTAAPKNLEMADGWEISHSATAALSTLLFLSNGGQDRLELQYPEEQINILYQIEGVDADIDWVAYTLENREFSGSKTGALGQIPHQDIALIKVYEAGGETLLFQIPTPQLPNEPPLETWNQYLANLAYYTTHIGGIDFRVKQIEWELNP